MRLYRICRSLHGPTAYSGAGALTTSGRWHHKGTRIVYTASSLALATLELRVHLPTEPTLTDFVFVPADVPDDIQPEEHCGAPLPAGWDALPAPDSCQRLGTAWVRKGRRLITRVPSAVLPGESNYLLNPAHPDFSRVVIHPPQPLRLDPRLWRS